MQVSEQMLIDAFMRGESWRKRNYIDPFAPLQRMAGKAARDYADATLSALTEQWGEAQCCMCGKKGLSTIEGDGGTECQLEDEARDEHSFTLRLLNDRIKALEEALTRISAIEYGKPDTLYAHRAVIDYARDQARTTLQKEQAE